MNRGIVLIVVIMCSWMSLSAQQRVNTQLSGRITDAATGSPLPGASVYLPESRTGTRTDTAGRFRMINLPTGHTLLEISFSGYRSVVEHVDLDSFSVRDFALLPSVVEQEGVTVTAVANATSIRRVPIPITRVNKDALLSTPSTNIIDALTRQPGVSGLSTGPAISKPVIRGLGSNRLVVINDGIRQEGQQWGDEHGIEIDENSVSRVEIVKGPASLIYGSDALAGVINIITTAPLPDNTIRGSLISNYMTNNRQRSLYAAIGGNRHGFNWNAWGDHKAAADYRNRYDGRVYNSKFREGNFGGYAGYNGSWGFMHLIVSRFDQKLGVIEGERDGEGRFVKGLPGGVVAPAAEDDFLSLQPQTPYQHVTHSKITADNSFRIGRNRLTAVIGLQRNQRREYGDPDDPHLAELYFDLRTVNYNLAYHLNDRNGWSTSFGLNGMHQENVNKGAEVLIPAYRLFDLGGFAYAQKSIGAVTVSGGLRYDRRALRGDAYDEGGVQKFASLKRTFANVSGSAGLSYALSEKLGLKLNLARGFRAPSMPELSSNGTHEGTNRYEYGSSRLRSEKSFQTDLGLDWVSDHLSMNASLFYNRINDFIFYNRLKGVNGLDSLVEVDGSFIPAFAFNQRNASLYGAEWVADLHPHPLDWLHWENTFSFVRGRFAKAIEGDSDLPLIPASRLRSELRAELLEKGKWLRGLNLHFEVDHTFAQQHFLGAYETETATASYTLLHTGVSAQIVKGERVLATLYINGHNLGDVAYQQHLSRLKYTAVNAATGRQGVFNMGRNFSFRLHLPLQF